MASDKVEAFRQNFRSGIAPDYSGVRHGLTALLIGLMAIATLIYAIRSPVSWIEMAIIPTTAIGWNLVEWVVHTFILHRPGKGKIGRMLYQRHTQTHHQFFTHEHSSFEGPRDLSIVFFPVFALPIVLLLATPAALVALMFVSANAALILLATIAAMYILFEVMHLCAHVPENAFVRHCPLVNTMRRHHIAHHDQRLMMSTNMTFTFPFADWLMGSSDLDRGFWGMTFNGLSTRYVKRRERTAPLPEATEPSA
jgi:hypothetical protein